jgi:hypothetical protein
LAQIGVANLVNQQWIQNWNYGGGAQASRCALAERFIFVSCNSKSYAWYIISLYIFVVLFIRVVTYIIKQVLKYLIFYHVINTMFSSEVLATDTYIIYPYHIVIIIIIIIGYRKLTTRQTRVTITFITTLLHVIENWQLVRCSVFYNK